MSSSDELKVPSQRTDDPDERARAADERRRADLPDHDLPDHGLPAEGGPAGDEPARDRQARDEESSGERSTDEDPRSPGERFSDEDPRSPGERIPGQDHRSPGERFSGQDSRSPGDDERDRDEEFVRTGDATVPVASPAGRSPQAGDDHAAAVPGAVTPDPAHAPREAPAHAAPGDVTLFDQDPAQVQERWHEVQASFVDDPGQAVRRADSLVGEMVESLTSNLTSRTDALRDRWKDAESPDTEQLRLALRDYRNVMERLLSLSGHHREGTR